jgi:hypothetical protein
MAFISSAYEVYTELMFSGQQIKGCRAASHPTHIYTHVYIYIYIYGWLIPEVSVLFLIIDTAKT